MTYFHRGKWDSGMDGVTLYVCVLASHDDREFCMTHEERPKWENGRQGQYHCPV
jgi:hypothetical protein